MTEYVIVIVYDMFVAGAKVSEKHDTNSGTYGKEEKEMDERKNEKERRQDKYEEGKRDAVEEILWLAANGQQAELKERAEKIVDEVERMAYMDGYIYAIAVLEETLGHMK